jgi:YqjK-like protein
LNELSSRVHSPEGACSALCCTVLVHWLRQHPEWPLGALAVLVLLRPARVVRWSVSLLWDWQLWRRARPAVQWLGARFSR